MDSEPAPIEVLKAMANPIRLEILRFLRPGPCCASKTNEAIPISQPNLSQHLKALKDAGLIDCGCDGPKRCYYICRPSLVNAILDELDKAHDRLEMSCEEINRQMKKVRQ